MLSIDHPESIAAAVAANRLGWARLALARAPRWTPDRVLACAIANVGLVLTLLGGVL